jgi:hypothetical protein
MYYQLVYTFSDLLPPPLDDTPAGLRARNLAAIAKVAALLPVNANEADLAAQCIAARAQAEDVLRLLRQHAGDIHMTIRLNAQYTSMVRTSLSVHARLMRVQALRQKRETAADAAETDACALHIAERSMMEMADAAWPEAAPKAAPAAAPAPDRNQKIDEIVSEMGTISHNVAFETRVNAQPWSRGFTGANEAHRPAATREVMAEALSG